MRDVAAFANTGESSQASFIIIGIDDPHKKSPKFNKDMMLRFEKSAISQHNQSINNQAAYNFRFGLVELTYEEYRVREGDEFYGIGVYMIIPKSRPVYFIKDQGLLWVRRSDSSRSPHPSRTQANADDFIRLYSEYFAKNQICSLLKHENRQEFNDRLKETTRKVNAHQVLANLLLDGLEANRIQVLPCIAELDAKRAFPLLSGLFLFDAASPVRIAAWHHIRELQSSSYRVKILLEAAFNEILNNEDSEIEWIDFILDEIRELDQEWYVSCIQEWRERGIILYEKSKHLGQIHEDDGNQISE